MMEGARFAEEDAFDLLEVDVDARCSVLLVRRASLSYR